MPKKIRDKKKARVYKRALTRKPARTPKTTRFVRLNMDITLELMEEIDSVPSGLQEWALDALSESTDPRADMVKGWLAGGLVSVRLDFRPKSG